ncbi:MAG TPA: glycosyltransferase family 2 protein [Verrucomicrobiae bacterium]|nr:glycosyltransferase family 2 protein [Verrucomicrobiae bacterium]
MRFSVITPSFRNSDWLKLCVASVADQGVACEHIVQDAGSDDGTLDWLTRDARVKVFVEKDSGMYDAVNRGLRRAEGDILSYLNCDEQYLRGALAAVETFFAGNPQVDVLFADFVVVDADGNYRFHRKVQTPTLYHTWVAHLPAFTCGTFFRRRIISELGIFFDPKLRAVGDAEWMLRLLRQRVRMAVLRRFTSAFTLTGENLGQTPEGLREAEELFNSAPLWARRLKPLLVLQHRLRRLAGGIYFQKPFSYSIYTRKNPAKRTIHEVTKPKSRWTWGHGERVGPADR